MSACVCVLGVAWLGTTLINHYIEDIQALAGDVIQAVDEGALERERLVTFRDVVRGEVRLDRTRPVVFKFTGMPWEDLVLAEAVASAR